MTSTLDPLGELATAGLRHVTRGALRRVVPPAPFDGLDPDVGRVARVYDALGLARLPLAQLRLGYELDARLYQAPVPDGVAVRDEVVDLPADATGPARGIRVRSYEPAHTGSGGGAPAAALVHVHGGGFVIGSLSTHDAVCRRLAAGAGVLVQAVDYRLAPEHPFPAGLTDIVAVWTALQRRWVAAGGDPDRIGIGGDSAGGHAAATVADEAVEPTLGVDDVPRPGFGWMVYPGVRQSDTVQVMPGRLPHGPLLTGPLVARFTELHVPDPPAREHPTLNPLDRRDEVLAAHPPTWLQTVGFDPLLEQGRAYVTRLRAAGVEVDHDHEPAMAHGYVSMTGISAGAAAALGRSIAALRRLTAA